MNIDKIIDDSDNYKIINIGKDKFIINKRNKLLYGINGKDVFYVRKCNDDSLIIISYDEDKDMSYFDHIEFTKDKAKKIESLEFNDRPSSYMNKPLKYDTNLNLNDNLYVLNSVTNRKYDKVLYNSKVRREVNVDRIDECCDYNIGNNNKNLYCEIDLDDSHIIYFILNTDTMKTSFVTSSFSNDYIVLSQDAFINNDIDDNLIDASNIVSIEDGEKLDDNKKYDYKFYAALSYFEILFKNSSDERSKKIYNGIGKVYQKED